MILFNVSQMRLCNAKMISLNVSQMRLCNANKKLIEFNIY